MSLVAFVSSSCGYCNQLKPVLHRLRVEGVPCKEMDVSLPATQQELSRLHLTIHAVPTIGWVDAAGVWYPYVGDRSDVHLHQFVHQHYRGGPLHVHQALHLHPRYRTWIRSRRWHQYMPWLLL